MLQMEKAETNTEMLQIQRKYFQQTNTERVLTSFDISTY